MSHVRIHSGHADRLELSTAVTAIPSLVARGTARAFETLLVWQERASERSNLAGLSDHSLKDMGLSRADVAQEITKPFWRA